MRFIHLQHILIFLIIVLFSYSLIAENKKNLQQDDCKDHKTNNLSSSYEINFSENEIEAINTIKMGGDVAKLCVDENVISYIRNVCITAGRTPQFDRRVNTCVETFIMIERSGLRVMSYGREPALSGIPVVRIQGDILREMISNLDEYPISVRRDLERNFTRRERGNRTNFPILSNTLPSKVSNAFNTLSL